MIFARSTWGSGVAAEAVRAVIDRASRRGVQTISADVDPRNERALKFLTRLSFVAVGQEKRTYKIGDEWTDSVYLELRLAS
jgi:RimJ/RimL family protein N-acetyltransferase